MFHPQIIKKMICIKEMKTFLEPLQFIIIKHNTPDFIAVINLILINISHSDNYLY